jgi:hypothetical protein
MAVCQPFLFNAPSKLTGDWFSEKEGVFSTMAGVNANVFGCLLGFFLPKIFIKPAF